MNTYIHPGLLFGLSYSLLLSEATRVAIIPLLHPANIRLLFDFFH